MKTKDVEATAGIWYDPGMKVDEAIRRLRQREADVKKLGVEQLYLFGSTARGQLR